MALMHSRPDRAQAQGAFGYGRRAEHKVRRSSEVAGARVGKAFTEGADKAGGAMSKLGDTASNWAVPFAASLTTIGKHLDDTDTKTQKLHASLSEAGKVTLFAGGAGLSSSPSRP